MNLAGPKGGDKPGSLFHGLGAEAAQKFLDYYTAQDGGVRSFATFQKPDVARNFADYCPIFFGRLNTRHLVAIPPHGALLPWRWFTERLSSEVQWL